MLEIFGIMALCGVNRKNATARGASPGKYTVFTILLWVGLEFLGAVIGQLAELGLGAYGSVWAVKTAAMLPKREAAGMMVRLLQRNSNIAEWFTYIIVSGIGSQAKNTNYLKEEITCSEKKRIQPYASPSHWSCLRGR